jgi:hypothetical protein
VFTESAATDSIVRIATDDGLTVGTGFAVTRGGDVLTCHHVVAGLERVRLERSDGDSCECVIEAADLYPEVDLALIRAPTLGVEPIGIAPEGGLPFRYWAKGFQHQSDSILAAVPLVGEASGTTAIRYEGVERADEYELDGVIALAGAGIDAGLSGAPLVDRMWGVAVGVVTASSTYEGLKGFAVPISRACARPEVAELVARNDEEVGRFGPFLNRSGVRELCRRALDRELRLLADTDLLLLDRYVARPALAETIGSFAESDASILALVGLSGVGKTTEVARAARELSARRPTIFLSGAGLSPVPSGGLMADLDAELRDGSVDNGATLDGAAAAVAGRGRGEGLLVFVDALNELPDALRSGFGPWIARSLDWLRRADAQLVVTCRPEYWQMVRRWFPRDLLWRPPEAPKDDPAGPVAIGSFTREEAAAALQAYDLETTQLDVEDVQHPFLARVYWELASEGEVSRLDRYEALSRYVGARCERVALKLGVPVATVHSVVVEVAGATLARRDMALDEVTHAQLTARHPQIVPELLRENLLVEIGGAVHFAFDEVAELLQARHLPAAQVTSAGFLDRVAEEDESPRVGTLVFAFLRIERESGTEAFVSAFEHLVRAYERTRGFWIEYLIHRVAMAAASPQALVEPLLEYAELSLHADNLEFFPAQIARDVALERASKFALLRVLARHEYFFDWEWHHWELRSVGVEPEFPDVADVIAREIQDAPVEAFALLVDWLDDGRSLREGGSTVGDLAAGLMWQQSHLAFEELCELLIDHPFAKRAYLLSKLGILHPEPFVGVLEAWQAATDEARRAAAASGAMTLLGETNVDPRIAGRALTCLRRAAAGDDEAAAIALVALVGRAETRPEVLDRVLDRLGAGDERIPPSSLSGALQTDFAKIFPVLHERLRVGADVEDVVQVLSGHPVASVAEAEQIVAALEEAWGEGRERPYVFAAALERILGRSGEVPVLEQVLPFAERLLWERGENVRVPFEYVAVARSADAEGELGVDLRLPVLDLLIRTAAGEEDLATLVGRLAGSRSWLDFVLDRVLAAPYDGVAWEHRLIRAATGRSNDVTAALVARCGQGKQLHGSFACAVAELVARGVAPQRAVLNLLSGEDG